MKTILTIEFTETEAPLIADILALIATARRGIAPDCCYETQPEQAKDKKPEALIRSRRPKSNVTHDDIRDLMSEVIGYDEDNRRAALKQLAKIGAKSVGRIKDEDLDDFFEFLQSLKDEY